MSTPQLHHRLTSMDSSFLYFEKKEATMHIGSVSVFDGEIPFEDFVAMLDSKMHLLPRYQQIVVRDPFNLGHPTWEDDLNFNIHNHIFKVQADAPGGEKELIDLAGRIFTPMMDRNKPLWDIYLVYGLEGGRTAMVARVHHCMVDGMSGVDLLKIVLDFSPDVKPLSAKPEAKPRQPQPDPTRRLFDSILGGMQEGMDRWMEFQNGLLNLTKALTNETSRAAMKNISSELPRIASPASPLPFNGALSGERRLVWNTFNFAEARAMRGALGGTVNDVVLTALSGAVARYVESHGHRVEGRNVRVMVPVSLRQDDQRGALGNLVSVLPVEIPLDLKDPVERFRYINQKTSAMKAGRVAEGLNLFSALVGTLPPPMQALVGALSTANLPLPPFNIISTNVPGPQVPMYAMGKRMTAYYPYVPVGFGLGCGCAIMSYDQHLFFGLTADTKAMPDVERLREFLYESFYELRKVAGVEEIKPQVIKAKAAKGRRG
ncbi:MAG TPA: wax ester/triacylglycerol synthase family O-acyltransferase [Blastocatellia bacterium]|nr:wax ester/triacylglycerol synthase family O-acyltransferase [Blastocatellia bacterium]HMX29547.1 wax ester/triacylglycerol synthase family O-acyltransferase [Blastocatellia bacterium]HMZ17255.1 wax ester/triacylglycerol synthase family O-acyltransferase [Blastocatellia bacterium]HNG28475.1 wax ester/triacylglycerol synthase family O-acyltransferase [Blastocatellia bacterium]